ncbi:aminopeptidase P family protein [Sanguibacter sp. A247]|uniref:aminopeptidase P family protein n=1 Tax=unclassified Sanguibacter TaxID=2645534 RepID=UPI003FD82DE0
MSTDATTPGTEQDPTTTPDAAVTEQSLAARGEQRSQRPDSSAFRDFVMSGWGAPTTSGPVRAEVADFAQRRRDAISAQFPGARLVVPAGPLKVRSNDTDYRFRPHSAFAHLTGLGTDQEPDAVLVLHPRADGGHDSVLYFRPASGRDTDEFFSSSRYGEFWVGPRPTLEDLATVLGIETRHLDTLEDALAKDVGAGTELLVVAEADENITVLVEAVRAAAGVEQGEDARLAEAASELRLVKDAWEIEQMRAAVAASVTGFEEIVRALPRAVAHERGERVVEAAFDGNARIEGNAVGYDTIAAAGDHATTLHWIRNDGKVREGELILVDAGVEVDSLYTADVTRTLPVSGTFTDVQRKVYEAVREAADAAFEAAVPGNVFSDVHAAAMEVIARKVAEWGLLPEGVTAEVSLAPEGQFHRRWMVHGTSHHLGIDVHDCAQARRDMYVGGKIVPGMVFTIEPGLYFKSDDMLVPAEFRGIGVRIEDDVLVTVDGNENLTAALPRTADEVEAWMASLR